MHDACLLMKAADLIWGSGLSSWSGEMASLYPNIAESSDSLIWIADAAPSVGFEGYFQGQAKFFDFVLESTSSALYEFHAVFIDGVL